MIMYDVAWLNLLWTFYDLEKFKIFLSFLNKEDKIIIITKLPKKVWLELKYDLGFLAHDECFKCEFNGRLHWNSRRIHKVRLRFNRHDTFFVFIFYRFLVRTTVEFGSLSGDSFELIPVDKSATFTFSSNDRIIEQSREKTWYQKFASFYKAPVSKFVANEVMFFMRRSALTMRWFHISM